MRASRAEVGISRNTAAETKIRGQSQPRLAAFLKGVPPAIRQFLAVSSICVGWAAAALQ
jgi:hypothetical protein